MLTFRPTVLASNTSAREGRFRQAESICQKPCVVCT